jgi:glycosyltransferase involved in cell wall biosynthesis
VNKPLRILSIHNSYRLRGGEDESRESEERLLREMGHIVDLYEENNTRISELNSAQLALKTVWSVEAYQSVKRKLRLNHCDLIHVQNFFPLISPSVYYAAQSEDVPVIQTLRNYRLICPNGLFFRENRVCEDCLGKFVPYPSVIHACYRQSRGATAVTASMLTFHRTINTWQDQVNLFVALSEFARQKFIEAGYPGDKIIVKPNFVHPDPGLGEGNGGYFLYVGRLSVEKGLDVLLSAWELLSPKAPLKIVGDGPLAELVVAATRRMPQIEWLGQRPISEVHELMGAAMFLIFPSKWYETFGRVAVEAFAKGTPVIASNIGAVAELIDTPKNGLCFNPGDPQDLANKIEWVLTDPKLVRSMRSYARAEYESKYTAKQNYQQLIEIYNRVKFK